MTFIAGSPQRAISQQGTRESLRTVERSSARSFRDRVANLFKANPHVWLDGLQIADVGGVYASRTRISNCRRQLGMTIENKLVRQPDGSVRSLYRYLPPQGQQELGL